jgi:hypothetical protein
MKKNYEIYSYEGITVEAANAQHAAEKIINILPFSAKCFEVTDPLHDLERTLCLEKTGEDIDHVPPQ